MSQAASSIDKTAARDSHSTSRYSHNSTSTSAEPKTSTHTSTSDKSTGTKLNHTTSAEPSMIMTQTSTKRSHAGTSRAKTRPERVYAQLQQPLSKLRCLFLNATVGIFADFNLLMQRDEPCVHIMKTQCIQLLTDLYVRFVKPEAINKASSVFTLDYKSTENKKKTDGELNVVIGHSAQEYLVEMRERKIGSDDKRLFSQSVRAYYMKAVEYILSKFPLEDQLLT